MISVLGCEVLKMFQIGQFVRRKLFLIFLRKAWLATAMPFEGKYVTVDN